MAAAPLLAPSAAGSAAGRQKVETSQRNEETCWKQVQNAKKQEEEEAGQPALPRQTSGRRLECEGVAHSGWLPTLERRSHHGKCEGGEDADGRVSACSDQSQRERHRNFCTGTRPERLYAESAALLAPAWRHSRHLPKCGTAIRKRGRRRNEANCFELEQTTYRQTSKTLEGRSATFTVQGLVFFLYIFHFLTSIAARFVVTFLNKKSFFLSRLGAVPFGGLIFFSFLSKFFIIVVFLLYLYLYFFDFLGYQTICTNSGIAHADRAAPPEQEIELSTERVQQRTVEQTVEVPQVQFNDKVVNVALVMQSAVPTVQTVQKSRGCCTGSGHRQDRACASRVATPGSDHPDRDSIPTSDTVFLIELRLIAQCPCRLR